MPPLCPLSSCPPLHLPKVPALSQLLHLSPGSPHAACLPHGSHQASPFPTLFLQRPHACTAPTPRGPPGSTAAQALGSKTAAATDPFAGFLPCYHIETAAPPASSGVTTGTLCTPNWACVSSTGVMRCWRGSPRGTADCRQTRPWQKKLNILRDTLQLELKYRRPQGESTWHATIAVMQKTRLDGGLHLRFLFCRWFSRARAALAEMSPGWTSSSVLTVPSQRGFPRIPRQRATGTDDHHQVQMITTTVLSSSFCESTYQIDQRGQPPLCLYFQLCLQVSLSDVTASLSLPLFLSSGPVHCSGLLLRRLLHCQRDSLCAHPALLFLQTHSLHQFLQKHLLPVHVTAFFMTGLWDLSLHKTEHIPSRPMWQVNPLRTCATASNKVTICIMFLHQITVYTRTHTHTQMLVNAFWEGGGTRELF